MDSCGQAGGIWCLWDTSKWKVEILFSTSQLVHMRVAWKEQFSWLMTVVYANPYYVRRQRLWDDLVNISEAHDEPWTVLGDFNCILTDSERKGVLTFLLAEGEWGSDKWFKIVISLMLGSKGVLIRGGKGPCSNALTGS